MTRSGCSRFQRERVERWTPARAAAPLSEMPLERMIATEEIDDLLREGGGAAVASGGDGSGGNSGVGVHVNFRLSTVSKCDYCANTSLLRKHEI